MNLDSEPESADALSAGGRASAIDRAWDGYPAEGRDGVSSRRLFEAAWMAELRRGVDPERLAAGVLGYGRARDSWGPSRRPKAVHALIAEGRYEAFADAGAAPAPAGGGGVGAAPAEGLPPGLWEAVVAARGAGFAASYLTGAAWDGETRVLTAKTGMAAERLADLRQGCAEVLRTFEITVVRPGAHTGAGAGVAARASVGERV